MEKLSSFLTVLLLSVVSFAQPQAPDTLWTRTFGGSNSDDGFSIRQTIDGGYIITGFTNSYGAGAWDIYLLKCDMVGDLQWYNTFGGTNNDCGQCVQQTNDGGYIIAGYTYSYGAGGKDIYLIKTDSLGNQEWYRTFGGIGYEGSSSVQQTSDGGYIIIGCTSSFGAGELDVYLIKTDELGNQQWFKIFGGSGDESGNDGQQTSDGGYIIVGSKAPPYSIAYDVYLIKTDILGNQLWSRTFGINSYDIGNGVQQTNDDGYIIVGATGSGVSSPVDVYLIKTSDSGNQQWYKTFGVSSNYDWGLSVQQTSDSGYILGGYISPLADIFAIKTDNAGNQFWYQTYWGSTSAELASEIRQIQDGGYIILGTTYSFGAGQSDVYLIRSDSEGTLVEGFGNNRPNDYILYPPFPNPFNNTTTITFNLQSELEVKLAVYDITGKEVTRLETRDSSPGTNQVVWDASGQASGIYFVRLEAGDYVQTQKVVLLK